MKWIGLSAIVILAGVVASIHARGGSFHASEESVGIRFSEGGYRSYAIVWSDGQTIDGTLWHWPEYRKVDLRR